MSAAAASSVSPVTAVAAPPAASASSDAPRPLVGIGVLIVDPVNHPGAVLVGERKGSHGAATFATPGGHLEYGESWNLVGPLAHVYTTNALFPENRKHYVTLFLKGSIASTSAPLRLCEPDKCVAWVWMPWTELRRRQAAGELRVFNTLIPLLQDDKFVL